MQFSRTSILAGGLILAAGGMLQAQDAVHLVNGTGDAVPYKTSDLQMDFRFSRSLAGGQSVSHRLVPAGSEEGRGTLQDGEQLTIAAPSPLSDMEGIGLGQIALFRGDDDDTTLAFDVARGYLLPTSLNPDAAYKIVRDQGFTYRLVRKESVPSPAMTSAPSTPVASPKAQAPAVRSTLPRKLPVNPPPGSPLVQVLPGAQAAS